MTTNSHIIPLSQATQMTVDRQHKVDISVT
jgi:hypothetical protein